VILREKDVGGQERVTTDEEPVLQGLNSDQAVQISRLSSGKSFVGKRKKFVLGLVTTTATIYTVFELAILSSSTGATGIHS